MSCQVDCVSRLTTCPSQKTGIEMPTSAMPISNGSQIEPRRSAAETPIAIDATSQITAAPSTSESVTGVAARISGTTGTPRFVYETRSRSITSRFIRSPYCTGSGRSRPKS